MLWLTFDASRSGQPLEGGGTVGASGEVEDQPSCGILDEVQGSDGRCRKFNKEGVPVVQPGRYDHLDLKLG